MTTPPNATTVPLLLADPSPCLRLLVLRDLFKVADDDSEVAELLALLPRDPLLRRLVDLQDDDGAWRRLGVEVAGGPLRQTSQALLRLAFLGQDHRDPAVRRGVEYIFSQQRDDGSWPLDASGQERAEGEGYDMVPLQTAMPLRALVACGRAGEPRVERAFDWLLNERLPDGAWPTGVGAGTLGYVAGYRRLAHSRWGCRSNTTAALLCFAYHPERRQSEAARRALDLLLGRETRERRALGFEVARLVGAEPMRGFFTYYARFDSVLLLDLCRRIGATAEDVRVANLIDYVCSQRGEHGLWRYDAHPQASRWVTFDILRSLDALDSDSAWHPSEPRTPFRPYAPPDWRF